MSDSDQERQENELLVLESIYGERQFLQNPDSSGGKLAAHTELPENFKVAYPSFNEERKESEEIASDEKPPCEEISIHYLPPIILNFQLPTNYPSEAPPSYTLSCKWMTVLQLSELCKRLDNIWNEQGPGFEVLFEWMQFLINDVLEYLQISSPLFLSRISSLRQKSANKQVVYDRRCTQDVSSIVNLVSILTAYDSQESIRCFNTTYFHCGVCFIEKLGLDCIMFNACKHIYCTQCVTDYFIIQIRDGSVRSLHCPEDKCESQALPNLVKRLVPVELYEQYDKFLLQTTLDCMEDTTYCPRTTCQSAVLLETDSRNMGRCPGCMFVFCVFCKRTYHGISHCAINNKDVLALRKEYMEGTEAVRTALEKKYGKQRLKNVVEEFYSESWLKSYSKNCPSCRISIEKIDGCNKMSCLHCKTYFCWLCGRTLPKGDPYLHFNDLRSPCYNKLFVGVDEDGNDDDDDDFDIAYL